MERTSKPRDAAQDATTINAAAAGALHVSTDAIPAELRERRQWVVWKVAKRRDSDRPTKLPFQLNGKLAASNDPATWCEFASAVERYRQSGYDGIGFVFSADDPYCGIDLDGCRNAKTGEIADWAQKIIGQCPTYIEVSPSGTGVKLFASGKLPSATGKKCEVAGAPQIGDKRPAIEVYDHGRYFAVTGHALAGAPAELVDCQPAIDALWAHHFAPQRKGNLSGVAWNHNGQAADAIERCRRYVAQMPPAIEGQGGHDATFAVVCECYRFGLPDNDAAAVLGEYNARCQPPWSDSELRHKLANARARVLAEGEFGSRLRESAPKKLPSSAKSIQPADNDETPIDVADPWPDAIDDAAYYGLAGEVVRMIEPHSEADPLALLVQFLAAFGSVIGRTAYFRAEADRHYGNLFANLVGETSKGRKGSSWGQVARVFDQVDPDWAAERVLSGLSSGEGLIWAVRDPIYRKEPIRGPGSNGNGRGPITGYEEVLVDEGVGDKRLMVLESEFASVLKVASREKNTLSAILRQAWDTGKLRTLTKNSPAAATDAHISKVGHITRNELRRLITETDMANGLANRYLWHCVRRSKCLPEGGGDIGPALEPLCRRLRDAVAFARTVGEVRRDEQTREIWRKVYPTLSEGRPGLLGAATSRGESQVMRLAMLYALLDESVAIRAEHLMAGLAVWQHAEASARYIFGSALGDPTADELLSALRAAGDAGLTRSAIRQHFSNHKNADEINRTLAVLVESGRVERLKQDSAGGRPAEVWIAKP